MSWYDAFDQKIKETMPSLAVLREEPMDRRTTFRLGGPARRAVTPASGPEAAALLALAEAEGWPLLVVGSGSNLLAADEGVDRLVVFTSGLNTLESAGENRLQAGAGVRLARAAVWAMERSLEGLAFAHGIPGSLGGAVFMNAGAYGGEMAQVVESVTAWLPGRGVLELPAAELDFGYRHSCFSEHGGAVLSAVLRLAPGDREAIRREMTELMARRRASQPLEWPSGGSVFKRPAGHFAGTLIDQCGLKGLIVGGAQVSEKHAGFIINRGGATCADVLALAERVRQRVLEETGVELEMELRAVR